MKKFNITLESLEELYGINSEGEEKFKLSKQGIINFFKNLKEFLLKYNLLKNELIKIFNRCILNGINPGDSCKLAMSAIENMNNINYIIPNFNNNIFTFKEINLFVDTNREIINQISQLYNTLDIFILEFNENVLLEEQLEITVPTFSFKTYEGENSNIWNVKGSRKDTIENTSNYSTSFTFFQYGYNSDSLNDYIEDNQIKEGVKELGLLLYDQARILKSLETINEFIELLKEAIISCPLNFLKNEEEEIDSFLKENIPGVAQYYLKNEKMIKAINVSWPIFYIKNSDKNFKGVLSIGEEKEQIGEVNITGTLSDDRYKFKSGNLEVENINKKTNVIYFETSFPPSEEEASFGSWNDDRKTGTLKIDYVVEFKIESFD